MGARPGHRPGGRARGQWVAGFGCPCRAEGPKTSAEGEGPAAGLAGPSPDLSPPWPRVFNTPKLKAQLGPLRMICVTATECAAALWPRGKKDQTPEPRSPSGKQRGGRCQFGTGALKAVICKVVNHRPSHHHGSSGTASWTEPLLGAPPPGAFRSACGSFSKFGGALGSAGLMLCPSWQGTPRERGPQQSQAPSGLQPQLPPVECPDHRPSQVGASKGQARSTWGPHLTVPKDGRGQTRPPRATFRRAWHGACRGSSQHPTRKVTTNVANGCSEAAACCS